MSKQWPKFVPCSTKKHFIIYRNFYKLEDADGKFYVRAGIVCCTRDSLIDTPKESELPVFNHIVPISEGNDVRSGSSFICMGAGKATTPAMYFFGGFKAPVRSSPEEDIDYHVTKAYRYDLREFPQQVGKIHRCQDMKAKMFQPLLVEVSEDCVYALSCGKMDDGCRKPIFQKYSCKENEWSLIQGGDQIVDIINRCDPKKKNFYDRLHELPHVVIGHKIHLSLGHSSFTFDTIKHTWNKCKLFNRFWLEQEKTKSGLSPSDFYGRDVFYTALDHVAKKRKRSKLGGGTPFGFYGRGVVWDKNILIGVHYAQNCPLVGFLLDRRGRVVRSQRITLNNLDLQHGCFEGWARIVDLGRDGCFCLVHTRPDIVSFGIDVGDDVEEDCLRVMHMELVTFRLQKVTLDNDEEGDFLECEFLRKDIVERNVSVYPRHFDAFCV